MADEHFTLGVQHGLDEPVAWPVAEPTKSVLLGAERFELAGISADDPYFGAVGDGCEAEFARFCGDVLRADDICIDIGANIGVTALIMVQHVPVGRVVAVEPGPSVAAVLRRNVARSRKPNITVIEAAVGNRDGTVGFYEESAWGRISEDGTMAVPLTRVSSIVEWLKLPCVDFIKIDVEGAEFAILRDAFPLIERERAVVWFEVNAFAQIGLAGVDLREFVEWVLAKFAFVALVRPGEDPYLLRLTPTQAVEFIHMNLVTDCCVTNVIATNAPERVVAVPTIHL